MTAGTKKKNVVKKEKKNNQQENSYLLKEIDKPAEIAIYYGFTPIKTPEITKEDLEKLSLVNECSKNTKKNLENGLFPSPEEKIAVLRTYLENKMTDLPHPVMLYCKKPFCGHSAKKKSDTKCFNLEIIGATQSTAEAIGIKTAMAILKEEGFGDLSLDINSIGDRESISRYEKDLASYFRKNAHMISGELRQLLREDVFEVLRCGCGDQQELFENAPKSISSLSDFSMEHFKEVLEYLEALELPYKINNALIGNKNYCSQTIFEIRGKAESKKDCSLLAVGTRHNHLSRKIGFKKEIPIMSVSISYKTPSNDKLTPFKNIPKPQFYFIQLGERAKLKSLQVIEALREIRVPIYHSLTKDKFVGQLTTAENLNVEYLIIMGQKEAMEGSVVVRNMNTRAQDTISISELGQHVKSLLKSKAVKKA
jgi:histidyl-tRNA synthetase